MAGFIVVTGKTPTDKQVTVRSYEDRVQQEHELAQQQAQAEAIKMAERQSIPDVKIQTILSDYEQNEVNADNLYKGKVLRIAGIVVDIKKDFLDSPFVLLGKSTIFDIPLLQASFDETYNSQLAKLKKGDRLTVVCKINGLLMYVQAENCEIEAL